MDKWNKLKEFLKEEFESRHYFATVVRYQHKIDKKRAKQRLYDIVAICNKMEELEKENND